MEPGKLVSHYRIARTLGRGDMGEVYAAEDTKLKREVALKLLPAEVGRDFEQLQRFQRDAQAIAALDHPNIVTIYSIEGVDGTHFITMQLVEGKSLDRLIPSGGLMLRQVFDIAIPLADALAAAHETGIVHRSLKPGSIMIGADGRVRVLDFGLAKLMPKPDLPKVPAEPAAIRTGEFPAAGPEADSSGGSPQPEREWLDGKPAELGSRAELSASVKAMEEFRERRAQNAAAMRDVGGLSRSRPAAEESGSHFQDPGEQPTKVQPELTSAGQTPASISHMSPEQAEGKPVDHRSDIFSTGILLYQMSTGKRPFEGDSAITVITSILRDTPTPVVEVKPALPRHLGRIVSRCLEKDPERRYQSAKDLRNDLDGLKAEIASGAIELGGPKSAVRKPPTPSTEEEEKKVVAALAPDSWSFITNWRFASLAAVILVTAAAAGFVFGAGGGSEALPPNIALSQLTVDPGVEIAPRLTPDGDWLIYAGRQDDSWDVFLQSVGGQNRLNLTADSETDDSQPALSPDGERVAFRSERDEGGIFVMGKTGESMQRITDFGYNPAWSPDGRRIAVATERILNTPYERNMNSDLFVVNVDGGKPQLVSTQDAVQPSWSPSGARIAFWGIHGNSGQRDIWTIPAEGGEPVAVTNDAATDWTPVWSPDGRYLYFASDRAGGMDIWRVPIDEASGTTLGPIEAVTTAGSAWSYYPSFSRDGMRMAYVEGSSAFNVHGLPFNSSRGAVNGRPEPITRGSRNALAPVLSPDGDWMTFATGHGQQEDIFIVRLDGSDLTRLTDDPAKDRVPRWSPDSKEIAFHSDRGGSYQIWTAAANGSSLRQVTDLPRQGVYYPTWSPDGTQMAFSNFGSFVPYLTYVADPRLQLSEIAVETLPVLDGEARFEVYSWSPDGRRLAGTARRGDGSSAGIVLYSFQSQEHQMLTDFGSSPVWLSDSRRLLFQSQDRIYRVDRRTKRVSEVFSAAPDRLDTSFSVSGDRIYVSIHRTEADVWMLESW